jgi:phosphate transport system permease protein
MNESHFTGRAREHRNRVSVRVLDHVSRWLITVGGIGTIVSVSLVCVFLIWVVIPLFLPAEIGEAHRPEANPLPADRTPLHLAVDEYRLLGWLLTRDGTLEVFRLDTGRRLETRRLFADPALTAAAFGYAEGRVAFGFADGSVRLGRIRFEVRFLPEAEVTPELQAMQVGDLREMEGGLVTRTPEGQFRRQSVVVALEPPIASGSAAPVVLLDQTVVNDGPVYAVLTADGKLRVNAVEKRDNLLTGETELEVTGGEVPLAADTGALPDFLKISGLGDALYVAWRDGRIRRFITRDPERPVSAEVRDLEPGAARVTSLTWLLGRFTLLVGNDRGGLSGWFLTRRPGVNTPDGRVLTRAHTFPAVGSAVTAVTSASRTRLIAAGYADGSVRLMLVTTASVLAETRTADGAPVAALALAPREDAMVGLSSRDLYEWDVDVRHPEASLTALFTKVWYEGYDGPRHVWQSSSAADDFEMKLGLIPLIFGTLKATLYSLLFGVPIALLAALFTSEFMHRRVRSLVKPTVELMASLPSVVLGFLAGLVFAPFVERILPAALTGFFTLPLAFLISAYLWQLLPRPLTLRLSGLRFPLICVALPLGIVAGTMLGPLVERLLFAGDVKAWLDGRQGSAAGGWFLLLLPLAGLLTAFVMGTRVNPWFRTVTAGLERHRVAVLDIVRFIAGVVFAAGLALVFALVLTGIGMDPRGGLVGTYVQRNALVVGFVMGFAIIPIIYTIAEDALSTVPEHLRSASLGAGATPWQTAVRIVIPTAMSGLFSAVMIGLGRAVGETMVVLMAAGNTPLLDWNIFNGFRTLSANIAVELPEAVRNSTHYRTLFLAALTLFAMTFVLNTAAEIIRLRFRRRSHEL